jgi:hypothetical protein
MGKLTKATREQLAVLPLHQGLVQLESPFGAQADVYVVKM